MAGVFIGIGKGFMATIERSSADVFVLQPGARSIIGGPSGVPRRFIPMVYNHPDVVEVMPLDGSGGSFQSLQEVDPTKSAADRAREGAPRQNFVQASIIDTTPGAVTIPTDYSPALVEALRQPYTVAIDETAVKSLGVKLGDKALYNGRTVTVVGILRGYPNMMQQTVVMSRDTLRMVGQADTGPRVGPLMVKIRNPADAERVVADLNAAGGGQWKAWTRDELAAANQGAMFDEGPLIIILGGVTFVGIVIGVAITWQTLRGAIMANIKEFASLRALGVGMGSLRWIVVELSFWVGVVGVAAAVLLTWLVALFAASQGVLIALQPDAIMMVGGGLIAIAMVSGMLSLGVLKNSQPADLLR
jgi:putative ABC transport system permease protein